MPVRIEGHQPPGRSRGRTKRSTGSSVTQTAYVAPSRSAVIGLSSARGVLWAEIADYGNGPTPTVRTRLDSFDEATHQSSIGPEDEDDYDYYFPLVATPDGRLWTFSFPRPCAAGIAELEKVRPTSGVVSVVVRLSVSPTVCDNGADSQSSMVTVGRSVFVLIPAGQQQESLLYRVRT